MEFETDEMKALAVSGKDRGYLTFDAVAEACRSIVPPELGELRVR
mgnify:CR=1 FL=1